MAPCLQLSSRVKLTLTKELFIYSHKNQKGFGLGLLAATLSLAVAVVLIFRSGESSVHPGSATLTKMDYAVLIQQAVELQQHVELIASETDTDWQVVGVVNGKLAVAGTNTATAVSGAPVTVTAHPTYVSAYSVPIAPRGLNWMFGMSNPTKQADWSAPYSPDSWYYTATTPNQASVWAYVEGLMAPDCTALMALTGGRTLVQNSLALAPVATASSATTTAIPFWVADLEPVNAVSYMPAVSYSQPACVFSSEKYRFVVLLTPSKYTNRGYLG